MNYATKRFYNNVRKTLTEKSHITQQHEELWTGQCHYKEDKKTNLPVLIPWFPAYGVYIASHQMPEISTSQQATKSIKS